MSEECGKGVVGAYVIVSVINVRVDPNERSHTKISSALGCVNGPPARMPNGTLRKRNRLDKRNN